MRAYFGFGLKELFIFILAVGCTATAVSGAYIYLYGYDRWSGDMQNAQQLMLSALPAQNTMPVPSQTPALISGGQFCCPNCGRLSLPNWDTQGRPLCPNCGTIMQVITAQNTSQLAAWGGGG